MKKKIIVCLVMSFFLSTTAVMAQGKAKSQGNTGCGLGSMLITEADSLIAQLAMTLLNATLGNQTFGITSGTSNCKQATNFVSNETLKFVAGNMDNLAKDIAQGDGETLLTLSELMGIEKESRVEFYAKLQSNFSNIFTHEGIEAGEVIDNIVMVTSNS